MLLGMAIPTQTHTPQQWGHSPKNWIPVVYLFIAEERRSRCKVLNNYNLKKNCPMKRTGRTFLSRWGRKKNRKRLIADSGSSESGNGERCHRYLGCCQGSLVVGDCEQGFLRQPWYIYILSNEKRGEGSALVSRAVSRTMQYYRPGLHKYILTYKLSYH